MQPKLELISIFELFNNSAEIKKFLEYNFMIRK